MATRTRLAHGPGGGTGALLRDVRAARRPRPRQGEVRNRHNSTETVHSGSISRTAIYLNCLHYDTLSGYVLTNPSDLRRCWAPGPDYGGVRAAAPPQFGPGQAAYLL
jgi:hypothetical protein